MYFYENENNTCENYYAELKTICCIALGVPWDKLEGDDQSWKIKKRCLAA